MKQIGISLIYGRLVRLDLPVAGLVGAPVLGQGPGVRHVCRAEFTGPKAVNGPQPAANSLLQASYPVAFAQAPKRKRGR